MTPIEDPASVTIPSATTKEVADHEFITSATNISLNASNSNVTADSVHSQTQDGQKDTTRHSMSHDDDTFERKHNDIRVLLNCS